MEAERIRGRGRHPDRRLMVSRGVYEKKLPGLVKIQRKVEALGAPPPRKDLKMQA